MEGMTQYESELVAAVNRVGAALEQIAAATASGSIMLADLNDHLTSLGEQASPETPPARVSR